jgi:hypothetical protein
MTISTDDGSASIASAKILSGACVQLLLRSSGQDGAPTHYAAVQVVYSGPRDTSAVCQVELTSRFGQTAIIAAEVASRAYQQACCPYGTCCPAASTVTQHHHAEFVPPTQTVSFPPPPDAGTGDGATDAAVDAPDAAADAAKGGPEQPGEIDANPSGVDLAGVDSPSLESRVLDGAMVDSPSLESRALDGATPDSPDPFDLASGS